MGYVLEILHSELKCRLTDKAVSSRVVFQSSLQRLFL